VREFTDREICCASFLKVACSHGQSDRFSAEIDGDHEAFECTDQVASDQSDYAGIEHGDDKGPFLWVYQLKVDS
jgi:hypothetical protein